MSRRTLISASIFFIIVTIIALIIGLFDAQDTIIFNRVSILSGALSTLIAILQLIPQPKEERGNREEHRPQSYPKAISSRPRPSRPSIILFFFSLIILLSALSLFFYRSLPQPILPGPCPLVHLDSAAAATRFDTVFLADNKQECIGVSDGAFSFDNSSFDRTSTYNAQKQRVLQKLNAGDINGAITLWKTAHVTNDAEMLIYFEDQRVLESHLPYINLVVGTMLTGDYVRTGRDAIQGAYVAQKENNDQCELKHAGNCVYIRLLIANSGSGRDSGERAIYANEVAGLIAKYQSTYDIKAVDGWPFSKQSVSAIQVLASARIPMISSTSSSVSLTGQPYFWRVAPSDKITAQADLQFARKQFSPKKIAVFYDPGDPYSYSLGDSFYNDVKADSTTKYTVVKEIYTESKTTSAAMANLAIDALQQEGGLDLIYFSGYPQDAALLLDALPPIQNNGATNLHILGGDGLYDIGSYPNGIIGFPANANGRLFLTAFGYAGTQEKLGLLAHPFFCEYTLAFDPQTTCLGPQTNTRYYYNRADSNAILAYDAILTIKTASELLFQAGNDVTFSADDLQQALEKINGEQAIQGASGQISLGPDGDPLNKAVVILNVDAAGNTNIQDIDGCFIKEQCITTGAASS